MSSVQNNLTNYFTNALKHVDQANAGKGIDASGRINQLFGYVDFLIQNDGNLEGNVYSKHEIIAGFTNFLAVTKGLVNEANRELTERKLQALSDLHINHSKQELNPELLKSVEIMDKISCDLRAEIAKNPNVKVSNEKFGIKNAESFFNQHIESSLKEISKLPDDQRKAAYDTKVKKILADTVKTFGADLAGQVADSIDHRILPFKLQQLGAKSPGEIPSFEVTESLEAKFKTIVSGEFKLSDTEQKEVLTLIDKFMAKEVNEMQLKAEYGALTVDQKLYMEHLRQAANKIDRSSDVINNIVNKLGAKLPELIVPAIIGLIFGSLTGLGALGGFGAIAMTLLGGDPSGSEGKSRPPLPMMSSGIKNSVSVNETHHAIAA